MIEKIVLDYLTLELSVPVHMETPEHVPQSYVLIEKTGGGKENLIESATLAFQSYAPTLYEAAALNQSVIAALDRITDVLDISYASRNSDYNFTDTRTKQYRYQAVYNFVF